MKLLLPLLFASCVQDPCAPQVEKASELTITPNCIKLSTMLKCV